MKRAAADLGDLARAGRVLLRRRKWVCLMESSREAGGTVNPKAQRTKQMVEIASLP